MKAVLKLVRQDLLGIKPYAATPAAKGAVYVNANENPYPLKNARCANRYPAPRPAGLLGAMAKYYKVAPQNLLLCAGSDQAIDTIMRAFCAAGKDSVLVTAPCFSMYSAYARVQNAAVVCSALLGDGRLNTKEIINIIKTRRPKIVFISNPIAPLGGMLERGDILQIIAAAKGSSMVVVDEAYLEFAQSKSFSGDIKKYPNLIVLRTLSKAYALAGARVGAAIARREVIDILRAVLPPYPLSCLSINAAEGFFADAAAFKTAQKNIALIIKERDILARELSRLSCVSKVYPSKANFLLFSTKNDKKVFKILESKKIITRYFEGLGIRASLSTPAENKTLLKVLRGIKL